MKNQMRHFLVLGSVFLLSICTTFAQSGFNYQAVVRDTNGKPMANATVDMKIQIYQQSVNSFPVFSEFFFGRQTNQYGLITLTLGENNQGFEDIAWANGPFYAVVLLNNQPIDTVQFRSVPFSQVSKRATDMQMGDLTDVNGTPTTGQTLRYNGISWVSTNPIWNTIGGDVYRTNGRVGIGTTNPAASLDVRGATHFRSTLRGYDSNGNVSYYVLPNSPAYMQLNGDNGNANVRFTYMAGDWGYGAMSICDSAGDSRVIAQTGLNGSGRIATYGLNGNLNTRITTGSNANHGYFYAFNSIGTSRAAIGVTGNDMGIVHTSGPNNSTNVLLTSLNGFYDHGYVGVARFNSTIEAAMFVNNVGQGVVTADVKNFRMEHPEKVGKEIWYASLEGPEAAAYERGKATLVNGEATIQFSDHFELVANPESMTVLLTPRSATSMGLAVVEQTSTGFTVRELHNGTGSYVFDWEVKAVRKGFEDYEVIRDAEEFQPAPIEAPQEAMEEQVIR